MQMYWTYWMWTTGTYTVSHTIPLDWRRRYLVTGSLTQRDGGNYGHVYISTVCSYSGGDVVLCGIRDLPDDLDLGVTEVISGANRITIRLRGTGARNRAEGVVYLL